MPGLPSKFRYFREVQRPIVVGIVLTATSSKVKEIRASIFPIDWGIVPTTLAVAVDCKLRAVTRFTPLTTLQVIPNQGFDELQGPLAKVPAAERLLHQLAKTERLEAATESQ